VAEYSYCGILTRADIADAINKHPLIASLLYDINLLPEQIKKDDEKRQSYLYAVVDHMLQALSRQPSDMVLVPREIYEGALNYIRHVGANWTERGQPHPQQWIVDGLLAAAGKGKP